MAQPHLNLQILVGLHLNYIGIVHDCAADILQRYNPDSKTSFLELGLYPLIYFFNFALICLCVFEVLLSKKVNTPIPHDSFSFLCRWWSMPS